MLTYPPASSSNVSVCCCSHGARCTCSLKKEPFLDTVPEDISQLLHGQKELVKHRGPNMNSHESKPTIFTNGHHKPVHKFNDAHNHCGAPYRVPSRSNSQNGHRDIAQRSTDSLPLTNRTSVHHESPLHAVISASQPERLARSEHGSPMLAPTSNAKSLPPYNVEIPPLNPDAYSYSPFDAQSPSIIPGQHLPDEIPDNWFITHDDAHNNGPPSVPELADIDWTKYGFGLSMDDHIQRTGFKSIYSPGANNQLHSQVPSYATSMEHLNHQLGQSSFNNSSGDISDVDDLPNGFRPKVPRTVSHNSNDFSSNAGDDEISHRLSSASSYFGTPAGNMLASNFDELDIDKFVAEQKHRNSLQQQQQQQLNKVEMQPQPLEYMKASPQPISQQPTPPYSQHTMSTPPESIRGYSITSHPSPSDNAEPYTIDEAQKIAHMSVNDTNFQQQPDLSQMIQNNTTFQDPMWCQQDQFGDNIGFRLDDPREDEQWAR